MNSRRVRVRFAPSPTGPLHMGGVRTALYNALFARRHGGDFLLRIEDTDRTRLVPGAEDYIVEALRWCGIPPTEGFSIGGPCGPYRQSERTDIYAAHVDKLLSTGHAYRAWDTPDEIEGRRKDAEASGATWQYDASTRGGMRNSISLNDREIEALMAAGVPSVVRFKTPDAPQDVVFTDRIRGEVRISTAVLDDKVLMKADGLPTYHLANVVDDRLMDISHVIRGEEWLPSAPLHLLLYAAFGWEAPEFAHLPLILKPSGNGKLSKRDGDLGGFPVFPLTWTDPVTGTTSVGYRESGYLPEAFLNMLLMLGWNAGDDREVYTVEEAAAVFDLDRVVRSGARFNPEKARWFNELYLRALPADAWQKAVAPYLPVGALNGSRGALIDRMLRERIAFPHEAAAAKWLFEAPAAMDEALVAKKWTPETSPHLDALAARWSALADFTAATLESDFAAFLTERGVGMGAVMLPLRLALTGVGGGPSMFDLAEYLGRESTVLRIQQAIQLRAASPARGPE